MTKHIFRVPVDVKHFEATVVKGENGVRYWGSLPGKSNMKTFEQMEAGDEILFYRAGKYIAVATIVSKTISPDTARKAWGETANGETWELIYFLRNEKLLSLDAYKLNEQWGLKPGPVMGFSKLSDERVQPFLKEHSSVAQFLKKQKMAG